MKSKGKYIKVFDPRRNCYIFEHDKVWLEFNGFFELTSITQYKDGSYVIHHINGNREDNRIENLQLMTRSEHASLHATWREPEYFEKISAKLTGIKRSKETRERMSIVQRLNPHKAMLGKHHLEETKQKIRESNIRTWANKSQEEKDRLNEINRAAHLGKSAPNKGVPCPEHQRKQLSSYWKEQYKNGYVAPSKGRIYVTDGELNYQVKPEELQAYLDNGFRRGLSRRKK